MARQAKNTFTLPDGRIVGYGFKKFGDSEMLRVRFPHPDDPTKYIVTSTGTAVKADAYTSAAKIILAAYQPGIPADLKKATWETAIAELKTAPIRPKTLITYLSAIGQLRAILTESKGPGDIDPATAQRFARLFASTPFKRGKASDAKTYIRSAQTVFNQVANLSIVWSHLKDLGFVSGNPWENVKRPKVAKKAPTVPDDEKIKTMFEWFEKKYPGWELLNLFVKVKMVSGCRLNDLCQIKSNQLVGPVLTITADQDKTHRERKIPLPQPIAEALHRIKGPTFLWERYTEDARVYRPSKFNRESYKPETMYHAVKSVFREYGHKHPEAKVKTHDLRKRLITLAVLSGASVDEAAQAVGMTTQNAQRHYLDVQAAYKGSDLLKRLANLALPQ